MNRVAVSAFMCMVTIVCLAHSSLMAAEPELTSSHEVMAALSDADGYHIAAASDMPGKSHEGDLAMSQMLEIVRPDMEAFSVSRLAVSCDCLKLSMEKKTFAKGERAFLELRNVEATPPEGATYIIFVKLESPTSEALQHFVFVKSGQQ